MATLEEYVAQATNAYKPTQNALQQQIDALGGRLENTNQQINKNFARQQDTLNRNRNAAASSASMQAAGSGGSFGGSANIANRKYYEQSFVPAQLQLHTNQANQLAQARQDSENERINLNSQIANLQSQAQQQATAKYWADVEAEKQRQFEAQEAEKARQAQAAQLQKQIDAEIAKMREQNAAQNAYYQYLIDERKASRNQGGLKNWDFGNGYSVQQLSNGQADYRKDGQSISAADFLWHTGNSNPNWDMWNDIWSNGVSTNGVGADTIDTFYKKNLDRQYLRNNYGYLF